MRTRMYYEHRETGSIYSLPQLRRLARRERIPLRRLALGMTLLPGGTRHLLREAEAIASGAWEEQERRWFERLLS